MEDIWSIMSILAKIPATSQPSRARLFICACSKGFQFHQWGADTSRPLVKNEISSIPESFYQLFPINDHWLLIICCGKYVCSIYSTHTSFEMPLLSLSLASQHNRHCGLDLFLCSTLLWSTQLNKSIANNTIEGLWSRKNIYGKWDQGEL